MSSWRVRGWWLLVPGIGGQAAADHLSSGTLAQGALIASYVLLALFLWANRLLVGVGLMAVGLTCNAAVVIADNGMPVQASAIVGAGLDGANGPAVAPQGARHHLQGPGDHLTFLDDRLSVRPLHRVASYGDVLLLVGALDVLGHLLLESWQTPARGPAPAVQARAVRARAVRARAVRARAVRARAVRARAVRARAVRGRGPAPA